MTSLTIPTEWLIPEKQWIFRCSTNLCDLVKTHRAARYFRELVTFLEHDHQIKDYHLKLQHNSDRNNQLDVLIYFGDPARTSNPTVTSFCISCEPTHELGVASLLSEQQYTRAWLDGRAREKLILTPIPHVERLSELTDEEMEAFWRDVVELMNREGCQILKFYPNMILNHGTYRNHAHLHLKINFTKKIWYEIIAPRHHKQIKQMKDLIQKSTVLEDCFEHCYLEKPKQQKLTRETNNNSNQNAKQKP
jgi:diadenosine tetraphosphate (Ap4A) HIT family hydrolase